MSGMSETSETSATSVTKVHGSSETKVHLLKHEYFLEDWFYSLHSPSPEQDARYVLQTISTR